MKTTFDIPDPLLTQAEAWATGRGTSLNELVVVALEEHLGQPAGMPRQSFFQRQRLLPEFARLRAEGTFRPRPGDRDVTALISEERDGR